MPYTLGIDIGVNSLGWCIIDTGPDGRPIDVRDLGVRIFTDGRDPRKGTSLAVDRRIARQMRKRRDRYLLRRKDLMDALVRHALMPADKPARKTLAPLDPYGLRARGLDEALTLHELGRALFHLHQRRGFKSNRKTDKGAADDSGKIKSAAAKLSTAMEETGARTLGEFLHRRHERRVPVRVRLHGEGAKAEYEIYPQRAMVEAEFDALWEAQKRFHPDLAGAAREEIKRIMFRQRNLRPVDPGKCALDPTDLRAPWALPLAQDFRILQELANLATIEPDYTSRPLDAAQRDRIYAELQRKAKLSFDQMRRLLKLDSNTRFNLESSKRDHLKGHETNVRLAHKDRFGDRWWKLVEAKRTEIVERLLDEPDEAKLIALATSDWGLNREAAETVINATLPDGYARVGRKALGKIVPVLRAETSERTVRRTGEVVTAPVTFAEACKRARYHHSDHRPGELLDVLPYYGEALARYVAFGTGEPEDPEEKRLGRIANPTVHIGLNQLRRLMNALIETHGPPTKIVVEVARDLKLGAKEKKRIDDEQAVNQKKNEARAAKLAELGQADNPDNIMRLRLWEELAEDPKDRRCVYTGDPIPIGKLFTSEIAIDHVLPYADTFDNRPANRILCFSAANARKGKKTPFQAFGHLAEWKDMLARAETLPKNKRWRFAPDALDRLKLKGREGLPADAIADMELGDGFLARNLIDTQYLSRVTHEYLAHVCDPNQVYVIPGQLTGMLRRRWGLNGLLPDSNFADVGDQKNRKDHRHHAIDAFVVGVTDRSMLQAVAAAAKESRGRLIDDMPEPFAGFRDQLRAKLDGTIVSLRPDHGKGGRLHEDTAYGLVKQPEKEDGYNLVYRKPFAGLNENEIDRIRDRRLREKALAAVAAAKEAKGGKLSPVELKQALAGFAANDSEYNGIRNVRLLKKEADTIKIADAVGIPYKALTPGENHHIDIWEQPDGEWVGTGVSLFDVNQTTARARPKDIHPAAKLMMRLHKGDLVKLEPKTGEPEQVMRVVRLQPGNGNVRLTAHNETGDLEERHKLETDPFRWTFVSFGQLKMRRARKVAVDILGRVRDPGPPK